MKHMQQSWLQHKRIVVTGAAGFLGSHIVDRLLSEGAAVIGVDNLITGSERNLEAARTHQDFTFINADVSQPAEQYLPPEKIDGVFHFASPASPPRYQAKPVETYLVNSIGTHYLLQYLKQYHPQARFFFASTSEVYGDPEIHPQPESYWGNVNPNGVRACYDESKRLGETICGIHQRDFAMDVRIVRIFNTYGPRMDITDGRIIPNFVSQSLAGKPITIYGDGNQTRSFCYVDDLVEGIVRYFCTETLNGETINLGNPQELTAIETADTIWRSIHQDQSKPIFSFESQKSDDPTRRKPDITKAQQLLDWQPRISFADGLLPTIAFFRDELHRNLQV